MDVCICGASAVEFWRVWRLVGPRGLIAMGLRPSTAFIRNWHECLWNGAAPTFEAPSEAWLSRLTDTDELGLSAPLDLYVSRGQQRAFDLRKTSHALPDPLPPRSLACITEHVFVTTPEFALALTCEKLSRPEAARLLFEFCGRYATDPGSEGGFIGCEPLTSTSDLTLFASTARSIRGASALASHLPFVCDGCASPMEAAMVAMLCLPPRNGGFGLPLPQANLPILPTDNMRPLMDRHFYVGDAVWPQHHVVAEYDSKAEHSNQTAVAHDNARRTALEALGHHVVSVTLPTLANPQLMKAMAIDLFKRLGRRFRPERFGPAWRNLQYALQLELLDVPLRWGRLVRKNADSRT